MKYYKGFNPDMTCRDFQYKEGETYGTNNAVLCKTGFRSAATNTGKDSVAVAWGIDSKAKAAEGSYIVLAEWISGDDGFNLKCAKMAKVDGIKIKADTFYKLVDGEFVEVEE